MKTLLKVLVVILGVISVAIIGLFIAAKIIITPERVRERVVPVAEKALDRPVSIGKIDVRLFSGIEINDFIVGSREGKETFISADALVLRYQIWPLLKRRVVIDEARLEAPQIRVVRFENGRFNFSDLLDKPQETGKKADPERPAEPDGGPTIDLIVNELAITGGELLFIDRATGPKAMEYRVSDLDLTANDIALDQAFPLALDARINGAPLTVTGKVNPRTLQADARLELKNFNVAGIMPYAADQFPGKLASTALALDLTVTGNPEKLESSGQITLEDIDMVLDSLPDAPITDARLGLSYALSVDTKAETVGITRADADINGIPVSVTGSIASYSADPKLDLRTILPPTEIERILKALPGALVQPAAAMKPAGRIGAEFDLAGTPEQPQSLVRNGRITLDAVQVSINALQAGIAGTLQMKNDTVTGQGLNIRLNDSAAVLDLQASNLMGKPIRLTHTLVADSLNVDQLTAALGGREKKPAEATKPTAGDKKAPAGKQEPEKPGPAKPIDLPLTADGTIRVGRAVYSGIDINKFEMRYQLENNIITVNPVSGQVAGGTVAGILRADLSREPIVYETDLAIDGTRTETLVSALFPKAANTVFGNLFLDIDLTGKGIDADSIKKSLSARGDLRMTDGKLTGAGFAKSLASFMDLNELQVLSFDAIKGKIRLDEGRFNIETDYNSDRVRMTPTGTIGLDGTLDLSLNMRLAPDLAKKVGGNKTITQLLQNQTGWALIPVEVGGSLISPRFSLDTTAVKQQLQQKAQEEVKQRLQDELFKRIPKSKEPAPGKTPPPGEQPPPGETPPGSGEKQPSVDQLFEKLFKK